MCCAKLRFRFLVEVDRQIRPQDKPNLDLVKVSSSFLSLSTTLQKRCFLIKLLGKLFSQKSRVLSNVQCTSHVYLNAYSKIVLYLKCLAWT